MMCDIVVTELVITCSGNFSEWRRFETQYRESDVSDLSMTSVRYQLRHVCSNIEITGYGHDFRSVTGVWAARLSRCWPRFHPGRSLRRWRPSTRSPRVNTHATSFPITLPVSPESSWSTCSHGTPLTGPRPRIYFNIHSLTKWHNPASQRANKQTNVFHQFKCLLFVSCCLQK